MDKAHEQAQTTRQRNAEARKAAREAREAQRRTAMGKDKPLILEALRATLTAPDATAKERLFAVTALDEIMGYHIVPYGATRIMRDADSAAIADFAKRMEAYQEKNK